MVKLNGEICKSDGKTIAEVLNELGFSNQKVAVEINEQILPKSKYNKTVLKDGDKVEIVCFVGGG